MYKSLCGNSYGCLTSHGDGTIGSECEYYGVVTCSRCVRLALDFLEILLGERPEFFLGVWMTPSQIEEIVAPLRKGVNNQSIGSAILRAGQARSNNESNSVVQV
jgi:hypothetical protein